jgi:hypothetical protein
MFASFSLQVGVNIPSTVNGKATLLEVPTQSRLTVMKNPKKVIQNWTPMIVGSTTLNTDLQLPKRLR